MSIQDRQNRPEALAKLAAQRLLYHRAKWVRNLEVFLVILVGILVISMFFVKNQTFSQFVACAAMGTWFLDQIVVKTWERTLKKEAATIQEAFDCFVLSLPWPEHKGINHPTPDRIQQLASKARRAPNVSVKLMDWYTPNTFPSDPDLATFFVNE